MRAFLGGRAFRRGGSAEPIRSGGCWEGYVDCVDGGILEKVWDIASELYCNILGDGSLYVPSYVEWTIGIRTF